MLARPSLFPLRLTAPLVGPRGLFSYPEIASGPTKLGEHVGGPQAVLCEHNQAMKPQVGRFADDAQAIAVLGGHHRLGRLLADFFQDRIGSAREQPRHIRLFRVAGLARFDHVRQPFEYVAHRPYISFGSLITGSTVTQRPLSSFWKTQLCLP